MNTRQLAAVTGSFSEIQDGVRGAMPILVAILPMATVFGAVAIEQGLSIAQVLLTSVSIYAVASQYVMVDLLGQGIPVWIIVMSVFAVNFRHVLYSAAIGKKMQSFTTVQKFMAFFLLADPQYAASEARAANKLLSPAYYFSYAAVVYITWLFFNAVGALFGSLIEDPEIYGIDFILPIYFTALVFGFRARTGFFPVLMVSAFVSMIVYFTVGSPWHITLGGAAGMLYAAASSSPAKVQGDG